MSTPTPPPERQSAYPHQTPPPPPAPGPASDPTMVYPAAVQPAAVQPAPVQPQPAVPVAPARPTGPSVDAGRYWAGVVATALVTALIGLVGVLIVDQILNVELVVRDILGTDSVGAAFVVGGVLASVLAGGLLHVLVLSTPKPRAFFGWIMFLATLTAALLPLTWTDVLQTSIASGLINAIIGIAIWSLLLGVLSRTLRPGTFVD